MLRKALVIGIVGLAAAGWALADTFRWVDESGVTVYSQTAPPPGVEAVRIKGHYPPPTGAESRPSVQERLEQIEADRAREKEQQRRKQVEQQNEAQRRANCRTARHNLEVLQGPPQRLFNTPEGDYRRLTEEERQDLIQQAEKNVEEFCEE